MQGITAAPAPPRRRPWSPTALVGGAVGFLVAATLIVGSLSALDLTSVERRDWDGLHDGPDQAVVLAPAPPVVRSAPRQRTRRPARRLQVVASAPPPAAPRAVTDAGEIRRAVAPAPTDDDAAPAALAPRQAAAPATTATTKVATGAAEAQAAAAAPAERLTTEVEPGRPADRTELGAAQGEPPAPAPLLAP